MEAFDLMYDDDDEFAEAQNESEPKLDNLTTNKSIGNTLNNTLPSSENFQQKEIDFTKNSQDDESDGKNCQKRSYR